MSKEKLKSDTSIESCEIVKCECEAKKFYEKYKDKIDHLISNQFRRSKDSSLLEPKPSDIDAAIRDIIDRLLNLEGTQIFPTSNASSGELYTATSSEYSTYNSSLLSITRYLQQQEQLGEGEEGQEPEPYLPTELYQLSTIVEEEESEIVKPDREKKAESYLQAHRIYELFRFLGSHLLASNPDNPIDFLIILLDNCLRYRQGILEPPLLFEEKHVESLFNSMDPMRTGFINMKQYHTGMMTLGIDSYHNYPPQDANGLINKDFFVKEAVRCLRWQLDDMIKIPRTPSTTAVWPSLQRTDSTLTTWLNDKSGINSPTVKSLVATPLRKI